MRSLRYHHPELWAKLLELDGRALDQFGRSALGRFKDNWNVEQLEQRFAAEDTAKKEAELQKSESKDLCDMFKGVPQTLEQPLKERQSGQELSKNRKRNR